MSGDNSAPSGEGYAAEVSGSNAPQATDSTSADSGPGDDGATALEPSALPAGPLAGGEASNSTDAEQETKDTPLDASLSNSQDQLDDHPEPFPLEIPEICTQLGEEPTGQQDFYGSFTQSDIQEANRHICPCEQPGLCRFSRCSINSSPAANLPSSSEDENKSEDGNGNAVDSNDDDNKQSDSNNVPEPKISDIFNSSECSSYISNPCGSNSCPFSPHELSSYAAYPCGNPISNSFFTGLRNPGSLPSDCGSYVSSISSQPVTKISCNVGSCQNIWNSPIASPCSNNGACPSICNSQEPSGGSSSIPSHIEHCAPSISSTPLTSTYSNNILSSSSTPCAPHFLRPCGASVHNPCNPCASSFHSTITSHSSSPLTSSCINNIPCSSSTPCVPQFLRSCSGCVHNPCNPCSSSFHSTVDSHYNNHQLQSLINSIPSAPEVIHPGNPCITTCPVMRHTIRPRVETIRHMVPVAERFVLPQHEKYLSHVPVTQKFTRTVVDYVTKHVPVIRHRNRTIEEIYTEHVPVEEKSTRNVIETVFKKVPVLMKRYKPVVHKRIHHIPVVETRYRPVIQETVTSVPVRQRVVKNLVEYKIRPMVTPCFTCALPVMFKRNACAADIPFQTVSRLKR